MTGKQRNRRKRWKRVIGNGRLMILGILFLIAVVFFITVLNSMVKEHRAEEQYAILASQTVVDIPMQEETGHTINTEEKAEEIENGEETEEYSIYIPNKQIDFEKLQEEVNPDIYAWVYIPDTTIDYPVLQHPRDNTHYLFFNIDGSKGYPGCIYSENYNAKDFSDFNTVLYGHNMKNGSMFAGLHAFEDMEFFENHPYIYLYTEDRVLVYGIFAAYDYGNTHLLTGIDVASDKGRQEYLEQLLSASDQGLVNMVFMPESVQDHILTLSTCIRNKPEKRYLVQGLLLN